MDETSQLSIARGLEVNQSLTFLQVKFLLLGPLPDDLFASRYAIG